MLVLSKEDVRQLVEPLEMMKDIVDALMVLEDGGVAMPRRMHADFESGTLLLMPCYGGDYFCTKMVSVCPENPSRGLPAIFGAVVLNEGRTGKPLCMIEGSQLTAHRTGAVGGIGIRMTTPVSIENVGLVGAGVQGMHQLIYACNVRPIHSVKVLDHSPAKAEELIRELEGDFRDTRFSVAVSVEELLDHSQLVVTATNSKTPVLPDDPELLKGKNFVAVGSFKPDMREMPDSLFNLIDQLFVDSEHAAEESGDVIYPLEKRILKKKQIFPIAKLVSEDILLSKNRTTLFKSTGMALFDLAAAVYLYRKAVQHKAGTPVDFID